MKFFHTAFPLLGSFVLASFTSFSQTAFYNANNRLVNSNFHSGCAVTVIDWNNDGLDDIVRLSQGHNVYVEIQNGSGQFETRNPGDFGSFGSSNSAWGMVVADVDHNGYKDILAGGNGAVKLMKISNDGMSGTVSTLPSSNFFMQNANFMDVNNDGWVDVFACDDNGPSHLWLNDGTGTFVVSGIINFEIHPGTTTTGDPWDSGNYGSVWTDFDNDGDIDLHIAKCRQSSNNPADPRRIDVLFVNNGNGTFTESAAAHGLADSNQTWTTNFADWDNDGDPDAMKTHENTPPLLLKNDGTGHFTDATPGSGFNIDVFPIESVLEDFDNDSFTDILISGADWRFFHNNGNGTFTQLTGLFDADMESFAIGDLNHDGFIDVYGSYANIYTTPTSTDDVVWLNKGNGNHFFNLNLRGTVSNPDAIGARASIYGPWGVQLRENHSGESYGTANSLMLHFGLGSATTIDSVVIKWPSGISQTIVNPAVDQFLTVIENQCVSPGAHVTANGAFVFCPGQTLTLDAPQGYSYLWNTGATTQSIDVNQSGEFFVIVESPGNNCKGISAAVTVVSNPDATPVITAPDITKACAGDGVVLSGPSGLSSYLWSNGATTQNTTADSSGNYTLTTQGACQPFTSVPVYVEIITATPPVVADDTVTAPGGVATLHASGDSVLWFDAPSGGTLLSTGNTFTTPFITSPTTYYAANVSTTGGETSFGGMSKFSGNNAYSGSNNTNAKMYFDVLDFSTLVSVNVYTGFPGTRVIQLFNAAGTLLNSKTVDIIGDSMKVMLDFPLTPGTGYYLTTDASVNAQLPGWTGFAPRLKRNIVSVSYPYTIGSLVTITGSDQGSDVYYYFYRWEVTGLAFNCMSERVPVNVFYDTDISLHEITRPGISIYPNPAGDVAVIAFTDLHENVRVVVTDVTGRVMFASVVSHDRTLSLATGGWNAGMYTVKIESRNQTVTGKLIVQH